MRTLGKTLDFTVLLLDEAIKYVKPTSSAITVLDFQQIDQARAARRLLILATDEQLEIDCISHLIKHVTRERNLIALFIRASSDMLWASDSMRMAGINLRKNVKVYSQEIVANRIVGAHLAGSSHGLIADASTRGDVLLVRDCNLETLRIPFSSGPLARIPVAMRNEFTIDADGYSISWIDSGIQLDLDGLRSIVDPTIRERSKQAGLRYDESYGRAIRKLRVQANLRQQDISGLSEKQISRIESGQQRVTASAISCLATAHAITENQFMQRIAELVRLGESDMTHRNRVRKPQVIRAEAIGA